MGQVFRDDQRPKRALAAVDEAGEVEPVVGVLFTLEHLLDLLRGAYDDHGQLARVDHLETGFADRVLVFSAEKRLLLAFAADGAQEDVVAVLLAGDHRKLLLRRFPLQVDFLHHYRVAVGRQSWGKLHLVLLKDSPGSIGLDIVRSSGVPGLPGIGEMDDDQLIAFLEEFLEKDLFKSAYQHGIHSS